MDESIEMEITMEVGQKASIKQSFHQAWQINDAAANSNKQAYG